MRNCDPYRLPQIFVTMAFAALLQRHLQCGGDKCNDMAEYLSGVLTESGDGLSAEDLGMLIEAQVDSLGVTAPNGVSYDAIAREAMELVKSNGVDGGNLGKSDAVEAPKALKQTVIVGTATTSTFGKGPTGLPTDTPKQINPEFVSNTKAKAPGGKGGDATAKSGGGSGGHGAVVAKGMADMNECDDWSSAWAEVVESGEKWGGRGHGGRGMGRMTQLHAGKDVVLEGVTMAFAGKELLTRSQIRLIHGHKYCLLGANGVGKTTLLRKMAACAIPGFPRHLKVHYCDQEFAPTVSDETTPTAFIAAAIAARGDSEFNVPSVGPLRSEGADATREAILADIARLEDQLAEDHDDDEIDAIVAQLSTLDNRLRSLDMMEAQEANITDALSHDSDAEDGESGSVFTESTADDGGVVTPGGVGGANDKAIKGQTKRLLTMLGFDRQTRHCPIRLLSGGWRARLGLALGLVAKPNILLLDEPTNHLDLNGVFWLQHFLSGDSLKEFGVEILLIVSHDRSFLDSIVSDVIMFKDQKLTVFPGNVSEYMERMAEKDEHMARLFAAKVKQEKRYQAFIASAQSSTSKKPGKAKFVDPKKQKAAKEKKSKLSRLGWHRSDGKAFATRSLRYLDEDWLRMPEEVTAAVKAKPLHFKFPSPDDVSSSLRSITDKYTPVLRLTDAAVGYGRDLSTAILSNLTLDICLSSRVSLVGPNGCGKSTLLKLLMGQLPPLTGPDSMWVHHNLRIAFVPQHHADVLEAHAAATPVQYLMETFGITQELKVRAHLGAFGLTGPVQLQPIGSLSGGQKARLSFAGVTWNHPHVIIMDEPTNHLDMESVDALAAGLKAFEGGVVLVSHNAYFMQCVCNELWVVEGGTVLRHKQVRTALPGESSDEDDADEQEAGFALFFEEYKRSIAEKLRRGVRIE